MLVRHLPAACECNKLSTSLNQQLHPQGNDMAKLRDTLAGFCYQQLKLNCPLLETLCASIHITQYAQYNSTSCTPGRQGATYISKLHVGHRRVHYGTG